MSNSSLSSLLIPHNTFMDPLSLNASMNIADGLYEGYLEDSWSDNPTQIQKKHSSQHCFVEQTHIHG